MRIVARLFGIALVLSASTVGVYFVLAEQPTTHNIHQANVLNTTPTKETVTPPKKNILSSPTSIPEVAAKKATGTPRTTTTSTQTVTNVTEETINLNTALFTFSDEEAVTYSKALEQRIPHIQIKGEELVTQDVITHKRALLYQTLQLFPEEYTQSLRYLTINMNNDGPRGLGGANTVIIRANGLSDEEFVSVFVHELGHVIDLGYLTGKGKNTPSVFLDGATPIDTTDSSFSFYSLSWENNDNHIHGSGDQDFVSGYAKSDPFEDFAESFIFYMFHGTEFRQMAEHNKTIAEKYAFLKNTVFGGKEYTTGRIMTSSAERNWDTTKLPVNLSEITYHEHIVAQAN